MNTSPIFAPAGVESDAHTFGEICEESDAALRRPTCFKNPRRLELSNNEEDNGVLLPKRPRHSSEYHERAHGSCVLVSKHCEHKGEPLRLVDADNSALYCRRCGFGSIGSVQLFNKTVYVVPDRVTANFQDMADLLVSQAFDDHAQNFQLT